MKSINQLKSCQNMDMYFFQSNFLEWKFSLLNFSYDIFKNKNIYENL